MVVYLNNYNLLVISCERICAVSYPVFYKNQVTVLNVVVFLSASWVFYIIVIAVVMTLGMIFTLSSSASKPFLSFFIPKTSVPILLFEELFFVDVG